MQAKLISIGNSLGVRLPKAVIEQAGLTDKLDIKVSGDAVIIRSTKRPRENWDSAAAACHRASEDQLRDWDALAEMFAM
ncbi:MAG: AbrB/MazE/SpoVT family DNA-binding domain-containing protein [Candidatus Nealsonbacteria bacterium]|nr:AbrB/MazE/SpoVT family DNA-binding domain-containing protein [Candidatus Nealsonbacteria bacterium]